MSPPRPGERTALATHTAPAPGPGQGGPHAHQIVTAPGGHVLAVDLGNDTVYTYRLDPRQGTLHHVSYAALRPGAGPRHLAFHPGGRFACLACEVDNTVVVCGYDIASGTLTPGTPQSTGTGTGTSCPAQLLVTGDGCFAYLANRGHNSLTRYAVAGGGAALRLIDTVPVGGDFPRQIAFSPDGGLLFAADLRAIAEMCDACLTALPDALFGRAPIVAGLGVAVPGLVGEARRVVSRAPHLEWGNVHVVDGLREELGNRVGVITAGNDANRAALAEYRVGSQAGSRDLVYISGRRRYRRGPDRSGKAVGRFAWIRR